MCTSASMRNKSLAAVHFTATSVANNKAFWILHIAPFANNSSMHVILKENPLMHKIKSCLVECLTEVTLELPVWFCVFWRQLCPSCWIIWVWWHLIATATEWRARTWLYASGRSSWRPPRSPGRPGWRHPAQGPWWGPGPVEEGVALHTVKRLPAPWTLNDT